MAEGLNRAMLIGNLGADPELRFTQNNRPVLNFRLATTESYATESGERKEVTHWHNVVLWGRRAEGLKKILSKGSRVFVEGRIETRSYEKDGVKRSATEINATNLVLLDGRREGGGGGEEGGGGGYGGGGGGGYGGGERRGGGGGGYGGGGRPAGGGGGGGRPAGGGGGGGGGHDRDEIPPDDFGGGGGGGGADDDIPF